jgi:hypothetical protein
MGVSGYGAFEQVTSHSISSHPVKRYFTQVQRWCGYFLVIPLILLASACNKSQGQSAPFQLPGSLYPHLVNDTFPRLGSNISLDEYARRLNSICVDFNGLPLLEYGDEGFRSEDYAARSSLIIDGAEWEKEPAVVYDLLVTGAPPYDYDVDAFTLRPDLQTGDYFGASSGVGPFWMCWSELYLERGNHLLEFRIQRTSGNELGYRWSFSITE